MNENVWSEQDGVGSQIVKYGQALSMDIHLFQKRGTNFSYYHANHKGSVTELTDANELILNRYRYKAFGESLLRDESVKNVYQYTGRRTEADTGQLQYNRQRYYMAKYGRFMNWDSIRFDGGGNLYRYGGNNPVMMGDPRGLFLGDLTNDYVTFGGLTGGYVTDRDAYWGLGGQLFSQVEH